MEYAGNEGTWLWPVGLALLGAIIGSFVATLVIRWPEGRSVTRGRSACDGCGRTLGPVELVPLLSAAWLRGRCRTCGAAIDPRHPLVELGCAIVGLFAGIVAPGPVGAAGAVFGWLLLALALLDLRHFWLPDRLTLPLAMAGIASGASGIAPSLLDRAIGGAAGYALLGTIAWGYRRARGREGLGRGDPKLFAAIGLWLGWRLLPAVMVVAAMLGLGAVALMALTGRTVRADTRLPFGTLLAAAAYPAWLVMIGWPA